MKAPQSKKSPLQDTRSNTAIVRSGKYPFSFYINNKPKSYLPGRFKEILQLAKLSDKEKVHGKENVTTVDETRVIFEAIDYYYTKQVKENFESNMRHYKLEKAVGPLQSMNLSRASLIQLDSSNLKEKANLDPNCGRRTSCYVNELQLPEPTQNKAVRLSLAKDSPDHSLITSIYQAEGGTIEVEKDASIRIPYQTDQVTDSINISHFGGRVKKTERANPSVDNNSYAFVPILSILTRKSAPKGQTQDLLCHSDPRSPLNRPRAKM